MLLGQIQGFNPLEIEQRMRLDTSARYIQALAKTLKLRPIRKRTVTIYGVVLLERIVHKSAVLSRETGLMLVAEQSRCHAARIVIPPVQTRLIDYRSLLKQAIFLLQQSYPGAFARQKQRGIAPENPAAHYGKIKTLLFHIKPGAKIRQHK